MTVQSSSPLPANARTHDPERQPWRNRPARSRVFGPIYRSGYVNAFLTGRLADGRDLALATGTHGRHYPFFHPQSRWDDVLLVVGAETWRVSGRRISALRLTLGRRAAALFYSGRAFTPTGAAVHIDFQFNLNAQVYEPRPQGPGVRFLLLGLLWQPALVTGTGSLTIHDRRVHVPHIVGEMERGWLTGLRSRFFQFGYEYLAAARPEQSAAYVEFRTFALQNGPAGWPVRFLLGISDARAALTLEGPAPLSGDAHGLKPGPGDLTETLIGHDLDLGPATIRRELVRAGSHETTRFVFRERISARP